jgi:hypothetical protein
MRKRLMLGAGVGVAAIAVGASPVGAAFATALLGPPGTSPGAAVAAAHSVRVPPTPDNPAPADPAVPEASQGPTLASAQLEAATEAVNSNPFLKGLTRGNRYTVGNATPWTEKTSETVIGAELTLSLASPVNASTVLPGIRFPDGAVEGYTRLQIHARVENVTSLTVMVDLRTNAVVSVRPDDAAVVTELPGNVHFAAPAED